MNEIATLRTLLDTRAATIPELLAARVARSPNKTFLIFGGQSWTYREAAHEIASVATLFSQATTRDRPRIASFLSNSAMAMWTWLGAVSTGGAYIPINRQHRGQVLEDMIRRANADVFVTELSGLPFLEILSDCGIGTIVLVDGKPAEWRTTSHIMTFDDLSEVPPGKPAVIKASDVAAILYTSGTTGRSKAVQLPHYYFCRNAARLVDAFGLLEGDVFHNWLPLYHLGGQLHMTMTAIIAGGTVALFPTFSRTRFWSEVRETKASVMCGFTAIVHFLWSLPATDADAQNTLRVGIIAGVPPNLHRQFEARFGLAIHDQYGMTEADPITIPDIAHATPSGSAGPVSPDFELAILDDTDRPLSTGKIGQIVVRPRVPNIIMRGYEDDDPITVESWRNLWFHTGDLGYTDDDGFLFIRGRSKDAIRRRGENISAVEVEHALLSLPDIVECAAVGVPSLQGEEEVKIVVVLKSGTTLTPQEIRALCRDLLAGFMVPRFIEIRNELPKSNLGKVEKDQLRGTEPPVWDAER